MSTNENQNISKSKQKRADRAKKNEQAKREGVIGAAIGIFAILLILGGIVYGIVSSYMKKADVIEPNNDYGKYLTESGTIEKVTAKSIVTLPADYNNISVPKSEVEYTDAEFDEEIENQLDNHKILNEESTKAIESGDKINLDYVGSVDGEEFSGGNTNGQGSDLEIGSGTFIPGFEDQLIGHKVGENFDIDVTFPDEYSEDLAGKDAVFNITINGIYEKGVFSDDFVAENLKAYATTVDGYREYLNDKNYTSRLQTYVENYITDNSSVSKYPKKYLNQLKALKKYSDQSSFEYMNQMYQQMYGYSYPDFRSYSGKTDEEYEVSVTESCEKEATQYLALQAIAETVGISVTDDDIKAFCEENYGADSYDSTIENYGKPYIAQKTLQDLVYKYLKDNATIK